MKLQLRRLITAQKLDPRGGLCTPADWMILVGAMACQFPFFFLSAHAILHMKAHGIGAAHAAWAMGAFTAVGILGRFSADG